MAERLRDNPLAALGRVPGVLGSLGNVLAPLENLPASLSKIRDQLPDAANVLRSANFALSGVQGGLDIFSDNVSAKNVTGKIDALLKTAPLLIFAPIDLLNIRVTDKINRIYKETKVKYHNPKTKNRAASAAASKQSKKSGQLNVYGIKDGQVAVVGTSRTKK